ncbi:MAG: lipoyl synthase [Gemmatimonadota bacterium]
MAPSLPKTSPSSSTVGRQRLAPWLRVRLPVGEEVATVRHLQTTLRSRNLHTVCEEAHCPNIGECWESGTATFMILGDVCTRSCRYCAVTTGMPQTLDQDEPRRLAEAVAELGLKHAVITSVNRDDLPDGGAHIFAAVIRGIRARIPDCSVEVLVPDFKGDLEAVQTVVAARPDIFNHNLETVEPLYRFVRPGGRYRRALEVLAHAKRLEPEMLTKSGIILGMGETRPDLERALRDLREAGVDVLTLGQYLRPSPKHLPIDRYVTPAEFAEWKRWGESIGFPHVEAGPLVRSSYHAREQVESIAGGPVGTRASSPAASSAPSV